MNNITYVSMLMPLARSALYSGMVIDDYIRTLTALVQRQIYLVVYTSKVIREQLPILPTVCYITDSGIDWTEYEAVIIKGRIKHNVTVSNALKDTAIFVSLVLHKFDYLLHAMQLNKYNTKYFAWLDAGLEKVKPNLDLLNSLRPYEKVRLMLHDYIPTTALTDKAWVLHYKPTIAAGFFTGNIYYLTKFSEAVIATTKEYLAAGYPGLEQEMMAITYLRQPHLCQPYYGDYSCLLCNYHKLTSRQDLVLDIQAKASGDTLTHINEYLAL